MNKREVGASYEEAAADYLEGLGYVILERNYHNHYGEIDIIAKDGKVLVAVEVKYRKNAHYGDPLEAVDFRKQKRVSRTFFVYYALKGYENIPCRFDVIALNGFGEIHHIKNAFDYT